MTRIATQSASHISKCRGQIMRVNNVLRLNHEEVKNSLSSTLKDIVESLCTVVLLASYKLIHMCNTLCERDAEKLIHPRSNNLSPVIPPLPLLSNPSS